MLPAIWFREYDSTGNLARASRLGRHGSSTESASVTKQVVEISGCGCKMQRILGDPILATAIEMA